MDEEFTYVLNTSCEQSYASLNDKFDVVLGSEVPILSWSNNDTVFTASFNFDRKYMLSKSWYVKIGVDVTDSVFVKEIGLEKIEKKSSSVNRMIGYSEKNKDEYEYYFRENEETRILVIHFDCPPNE